jgi:hypothetical protein
MSNDPILDSGEFAEEKYLLERLHNQANNMLGAFTLDAIVTFCLVVAPASGKGYYATFGYEIGYMLLNILIIMGIFFLGMFFWKNWKYHQIADEVRREAKQNRQIMRERGKRLASLSDDGELVYEEKTKRDRLG